MTNMNVETIDLQSVWKIYIFLSGYAQGKGNILPLGTVQLDELYKLLKFSQGDVRYKLPEK